MLEFNEAWVDLLKKSRKAAGFKSQQAFADGCKWHLNTILRFEVRSKWTRPPRPEEVKHMANVCKLTGVRRQEFFGLLGLAPDNSIDEDNYRLQSIKIAKTLFSEFSLYPILMFDRLFNIEFINEYTLRLFKYDIEWALQRQGKLGWRNILYMQLELNYSQNEYTQAIQIRSFFSAHKYSIDRNYEGFKKVREDLQRIPWFYKIWKHVQNIEHESDINWERIPPNPTPLHFLNVTPILRGKQRWYYEAGNSAWIYIPSDDIGLKRLNGFRSSGPNTAFRLTDDAMKEFASS